MTTSVNALKINQSPSFFGRSIKLHQVWGMTLIRTGDDLIADQAFVSRQDPQFSFPRTATDKRA